MTPSAPSSRIPNLLPGLLLVAVTLGVFWQVSSHDFVLFDDDLYVTKNEQVQQGLTGEGLRWALTATHATNWHPLTWLSHMLDVQLFGLDAGAHHLVNLALHALNALLLYLLLLGMSGRRWPSLWVAALFALHPLHVESVAWVAERKDVLSTLFGILTLLAYVGLVRRPGVGRSLLVLLLFALGLMAKPMLVTLPFVMLLLDLWPLRRLDGDGAVRPARLLLEKVPLLLLCAGSCVITVLAQSAGGALRSMEQLSLGTRVGNALNSYAWYIGKLFWPADLVVLVPHPGASLPLWQPIGAGLLLLGVSAVVVARVRTRPWLLVGWFWFLGTLVPVIGLVQVGSQAVADRYSYLPLVGLLIMLAYGAAELVRERPAARPLAAVAAVATVVACSVLTWIQAGVWKDSFTLFEHTLARTRNNFVIHNNLGGALHKSGEIPRAVEQYSEALRLYPDYVVALRNKGAALMELGRRGEAIESFRRIVGILPEDSAAATHLARALTEVGGLAEAEGLLRRAVSLDADNLDARASLAVILAMTGRIPQAIQECRAVLGVDPAQVEANVQLGLILLQQGNEAEAAPLLERALQGQPNHPGACLGLGGLRSRQGQLKQAEELFRRGLQSNPRDPALLLDLGTALARQGLLVEAREPFQQLLALDPRNLQALHNLARTHAEADEMDEARRLWRRVLAIHPEDENARRFLEQP